MYRTVTGQTSGETCLNKRRRSKAFTLISQAKGQGTGWFSFFIESVLTSFRGQTNGLAFLIPFNVIIYRRNIMIENSKFISFSESRWTVGNGKGMN